MSNGNEERAPKAAEAKPKQRRISHITIRLSTDERVSLDAAAERAGLMNGSFVRQMIFGAPTPRQVRRPPIERRELARLLGQIGAIGNNLNQIARCLNSGEAANDDALSDALDAVNDMRDAVLAALGRAP